jgi:hypothetical protein
MLFAAAAGAAVEQVQHWAAREVPVPVTQVQVAGWAAARCLPEVELLPPLVHALAIPDLLACQAGLDPNCCRTVRFRRS